MIFCKDLNRILSKNKYINYKGDIQWEKDYL